MASHRPSLQLARGEDAVLIVPPFADLNRPCIAVHLLQACAREHGMRVSVVYANVLLAAVLGERHYQAIAFAPQTTLLGERFFARLAYGLQAFEDDTGKLQRDLERTSSKMKMQIQASDLEQLLARASEWLESLGEEIAAAQPMVVGATSSFTQTAASVALLHAIKARDASVVTIMGGANCQGEMAHGIASLGAPIDYIFSGECEQAFPRFLAQLRAGERPAEQIIEGEPVESMDALPQVRYSEYYQQRKDHLPIREQDLDDVWLSYETSRGCWWGEKHHCTFCGLNGETMKMRERAADLVLRDLKELLAEHPSRSVWMVDNIMPNQYFRSLLPRLREELPGLHIYWDQKSNLTLDKVVLLGQAGVRVIQPGVEALSSSLLRRMDKGVTAHQNIAALRYGRAAGVVVNWNILFSFPGDEVREYEETVALMPWLHHLDPPMWLARVNIDRFSPYFMRPEEYGIRNLRHHEAYAASFPAGADLHKIAYHFVGDYPSATDEHEEILRRLCEEFDAWRRAWASPARPPPALCVSALDDGYLLLDTRGLPGTQRARFLTREQAAVALVSRPYRANDPLLQWGLDCKVGLVVDTTYMALATADAPLLKQFESKGRLPQHLDTQVAVP